MKASRRRVSLGLDRFSGLYVWALIIIVFSVLRPRLFPTMSTVHSLASQQAVLGVLALATMIPLAAGAYDLSVGATINLSTILVTWLQTVHHIAMWPAIFLALMVCTAVGVVNGFLVVRLHINSFVATLGTASIVAALQTIVSGNTQPLPPTSTAWASLTQRSVLGFQIVFLYLLIIALILWWALEHTPAGRYIYAVGSSPEASRLSGVSVGKWIWLSLIASAFLAGVAGVFFGSLLGPSLSFGQGLLLPAFAAAFLGSTQFRPGRVNVWGTLLALYVLATGVRGLEFLTGVQWLSDMFNGVALIAAVGFAVWRQRASQRARRFRTAGAPPGNEPSDPVVAARDDPVAARAAARQS